MIIFICIQFRAAISLQFDFHRAIYNLGTVLVHMYIYFYSDVFNAVIILFSYHIDSFYVSPLLASPELLMI